MKTCSKCHISKPLDEFNKRSSAGDGLQGFCKQCNRDASKAHYLENRESRIAKNNRNRVVRKTERISYIIEFFKSHPCEICGEHDPIVLEFDHIDPQTKSGEISEMITTERPWRIILEEIEKCRVLCANCHRRHTAQQRNWIVYQLMHPYSESN